MARATRQRAAVSDLLTSTSGFRSAQDLHRMLNDLGETVGLATVYRTLQILTDSGEVDALRGPDGEVVYRKCERSVHHHHLVCRGCGLTVELDADAVEAWSQAIASQHGFSQVEHTVELFGLCATCSAAQAASSDAARA